MHKETTAISRQALLDKANAMLKEHKDYFAGLAVRAVEQKGNLLIFSGDYFLDENGLPTAKSTAVFNVLKSLTVALSEQYHLQH